MTHGPQANYERILQEFGALKRDARECVSHLMGLGFSKGQARNAVYRFRQRHPLITKSKRVERDNGQE